MRILFFGHLKDITGCGETLIHCADANADRVWRVLLRTYPGLSQSRPLVRLARNWEYVGPDARFDDSDELALIPPVSGG